MLAAFGNISRETARRCNVAKMCRKTLRRKGLSRLVFSKGCCVRFFQRAAAFGILKGLLRLMLSKG
eukprot:4108929-Pleurochrysis_carterae.AAC.1